MKKILRALRSSFSFLLIAVIFLLLVLLPHGNAAGNAVNQRVVRLWNVDTFEGGKGSRTAFLNQVARMAEREREGVYYLISSYTAEGARAAFLAGDCPDLLSFGLGLSEFSESCLPLSVSFSGGMLGGRRLAYPWACGGYFLFCLEEDFSEGGETVLSCGGQNLTAVAAVLNGIEGKEEDSVTAYTNFLRGKYRYLLGTQRDVCRFAAREVCVYQKPLPAYNDLYQYICVLSAEKREDCDAFLDCLLSEAVQESLSGIGMCPLSRSQGERTVSVFSSESALGEMRSIAHGSEAKKNLDKFLKII